MELQERNQSGDNKEPVLKWVTLGLGWFSAFLVVMQFLSGWQVRHGGSVSIASHLHTGYMTLVVVLVHVCLSTSFLLPRKKDGQG